MKMPLYGYGAFCDDNCVEIGGGVVGEGAVMGPKKTSKLG